MAAGLASALLAAPGWAAPERADPDNLAVVPVGETSTAKRIAVVVPGAGTSADRLEAIDQPLGMARALVAEATRISGDTHTDSDPRFAAVAWAGYHAPSASTVGVARGEHAQAGADRLAAYLAELTGETEASVTLFCHSYGSVVCGQLAMSGLPDAVTDVVVFGSPGLGAGIESAADLSDGAVRVWAARAPQDWIRWMPRQRMAGFGHGADPIAPAFGARVITADSWQGHGDYLRVGTPTRTSFARIALGQPHGAA